MDFKILFCMWVKSIDFKPIIPNFFMNKIFKTDFAFFSQQKRTKCAKKRKNRLTEDRRQQQYGKKRIAEKR